MNPVEQAVRQWLASVVIGLNLCPFAAHPTQGGRVRVAVSAARSAHELLADLQLELTRLDDTPVAELETTLVAIPDFLSDFLDYNDFLDDVDALLDRYEWSGSYQVASFHPRYQFAGTHPDDAENLIGRAPYPLLHLLREDSVEAAIAHHPDPERIPDDNIARLNALTSMDRDRLFAYLQDHG